MSVHSALTRRLSRQPVRIRIRAGLPRDVRVHVKSENTSYTEEHIQSHYTYEKNHVQVFGHGSEVRVFRWRQQY